MSNIFNIGRQKAFNSLCKTLDNLIYKENISEKQFYNEWQKNLENEGDVFVDGWYSPPPKGMCVLFGDRISFDSLRNESNWISNTTIDWTKDLFYAYCSPIDKKTGIIGDVALTLYFGEDEEIINHFKNCYKATNEVFNNLSNLKNSRELFEYSQEIFNKYRLKNCVISRTDSTPLDLGHTFPKLLEFQNKESLTDEEKQTISKSRKFINANSNWNFEDEIQFTIEPQLISVDNPKLPQITQHYLIKKTEGEFVVCRDIDELIKKYGV